jgi:hypothetical protein
MENGLKLEIVRCKLSLNDVMGGCLLASSDMMKHEGLYTLHLGPDRLK